jgi:hypothetical protein
MNATDIDLALKNKFRDGYACFSEFRSHTGYSGHTRYVDMLVIGLWERDLNIYAVEIKTTRQDFIYDVRNYEKKQKEAQNMSNMIFYAVPQGLVNPDEVPEGCGLFFVQKGGRVITKKQAKRKDIDLPPVYMNYIRSMANRTADEKPSERLMYFLGRERTHREIEDYIDKLIKKEFNKAITQNARYEAVALRDQMIKELDDYKDIMKEVSEIKNQFPFMSTPTIITYLKKALRAIEQLDQAMSEIEKMKKMIGEAVSDEENGG